jgi:hypothetical protein
LPGVAPCRGGRAGGAEAMVPATLKNFVLETLTHAFVGRLNFRYGATRVYPEGYRRDIAHCVRDGLIVLTTDPAVLGPDPASRAVPGGAFIVETQRGHAHPFFIDPANCVLRDGTAYVKDSLGENELANLRGTIVHEATHALQDYQRVAIDPVTSEGAAYLAGAIARRLWGFRTAGPIVNPRASGIAYSLHLADRFLAETDPNRRYLIASDDVHALNGLVTTGSFDRYVFNGI